MNRQTNDVESKWKALCDLCVTDDGRVVTSAEWREHERLKKLKEMKNKQLQEEKASIQSWERLEFDTLNTLIMTYKQERSQQAFKIAWHDYLKKLTNQYLSKYIIKGLPLKVKRLYLAEHESSELQDILYPVLIEAIEKWEPNAMERNTRDFAAYYGKAVEYFSGNIILKYKRRKYEQLSLQYLDFYNEEQINVLLQGEPKLRLERCTEIEEWSNQEHLKGFIHDWLTNEQRKLFTWLYELQLPATQIARQLKCSRMTIYRKQQQMKDLWKQYNVKDK